MQESNNLPSLNYPVMTQENRRTIEDIVVICRRLEEKGFVIATEGNVSARLGNGNILCTRRGINKGMITEDDLLEVTPLGEPIKTRRIPSTELKMHLFVYSKRPDVEAIVHAHPMYSTGFATARIPLTECILPEIIIGVGSVPLAEYATPSTDEVAGSLSPHIKGANAILLSNHGVVTFGKDPWDAYWKMEQVERAAQVTFVAHLMGGEKPISSEQIEKLRAAYMEAYGKDFARSDQSQRGEINIDSREADIRFRELLKILLQGRNE